LIAPMPSLAAVASTGNKSFYRQHGKLIGREARALGFNVVLAPVLDLALPESAPVMRTRTFFAKPEEVTAYASAFLDGLESTHVLGCGKHFPGLGGGTLDSHHATPFIHRSMETLWENDLRPYHALKSRLPIVMISHASYPASGDLRPASISRHWITDVLTKRIGYRSLILSDDMEMGGILKYTGIAEAAVQALAAGTHVVEICRNPALVFAAYEAVLREAETSPAFARRLRNAAEKAATVAAAGPKRLPPSPTNTAVKRMQTAVDVFTRQVAKAGPA